jgi:hypothetical protein
VLSKLVPNGIKNRFPLFGKAAQDQHRFLPDCVNGIANLFVVKQQVNELGDLDIVDGDRRLTTTSYDQILLVCLIVHRYIPDRHAIDVAFGQRRTAKICLN